MKTCLIVFAAAFPCALLAQPGKSPPPSPTQARIVGEIPDGSPPKGAKPPPKYRPSHPMAPIGTAKTVRKEGRNITFQKVAPVALRSPTPAADRPLSTEQLAALEKLIAQTKDTLPGRDILALGATVYRFADGTTRTQATIWDQSTGKQHTFWSNADFSLLSGIGQFVSTDNRHHSLLLIWSQIDMEKLAHLGTSHDSGRIDPAIPKFDSKKPATYTFVNTPPADPELLTAIQSLHDIYNREHTRLLAAWKGRERARLAREKELHDNPPKPKDITLRYWRNEKPTAKGGDQ